MKMIGQIFYGAGQNAKDNIEKWIGQGYCPLCFVDFDEQKQKEKFIINDGKVLNVFPLDEALKRYPQSDIYITLKRENLKIVTEYLLHKGIQLHRIKYFEDVEYRLGCDNLGTTYLMYENMIRTCITPENIELGVERAGDMVENYQKYQSFVDGILAKWRKRQAGECGKCSFLRYDIFARVPELKTVTLGSEQGKDFCNAKCIYCSNYPKPSNEALTKRKSEVNDMMSFFSEKFPDKELLIDVEGGDISVAPFQKEIIQFIKENNWTACIRTNAAIYCDGISELLEMGKAYMHVTLDSTVPEIYAKCKGINCVEKVMDNLREYSRHGKIWLKWIALDGIYHNFYEIKGIIDFAKEINAGLFLSCDTFKISTRMSQELLNLVLEYIAYGKESGLEMHIMYDHFNCEDVKVITEYVEQNA